MAFLPLLQDQGNGSIVWQTTTAAPTSAVISATDSKSTQEFGLTLILCNCSNDASCDYNTTNSNSERNNTKFMTSGCMCTASWTGKYCTENFNACQANTCFDSATCEEKVSPEEGRNCGPCPAGLTGDGFKCFDINECAGASPCGNNAICTNLPGNHSCTCKNGYRGDPYILCTDINECAHQNTMLCPDTALCINTNGSYWCECLPGFSGPSCSDINECAQQKNNMLCPETSRCINTNGSYRCECLSGFSGPSCSDINECARQNTMLCPDTALCINTNGSYRCECIPGFSGPSCSAVSSTTSLPKVTDVPTIDITSSLDDVTSTPAQLNSAMMWLTYTTSRASASSQNQNAEPPIVPTNANILPSKATSFAPGLPISHAFSTYTYPSMSMSSTSTSAAPAQLNSAMMPLTYTTSRASASSQNQNAEPPIVPTNANILPSKATSFAPGLPISHAFSTYTYPSTSMSYTSTSAAGTPQYTNTPAKWQPIPFTMLPIVTSQPLMVVTNALSTPEQNTNRAPTITFVKQVQPTVGPILMTQPLATTQSFVLPTTVFLPALTVTTSSSTPPHFNTPHVSTAFSSHSSSQQPTIGISTYTSREPTSRVPTSTYQQIVTSPPQDVPTVVTTDWMTNESTASIQQSTFPMSTEPSSTMVTSVTETHPEMVITTTYAQPAPTTKGSTATTNSATGSTYTEITKGRLYRTRVFTGEKTKAPVAGECGLSTCPAGYCSNGGFCSLVSPGCNPTCECVGKFKGSRCTVAGHNFMPQPFKVFPTRIVDIKLTLMGVDGSITANPSSEEYISLQNSINSTVSQIMRSLPLTAFDKNTQIPLAKVDGKAVTFVRSEFIYKNSRTIITFLNENLSVSIARVFNSRRQKRRYKRSTVTFEPVTESDITSRRTLYQDELKEYFDCSLSGYAGYILEYASVGFVCISPCYKTYCQNNAVCEHIETGPYCRCVSFSVYSSYGKQCENLAINIKAFFVILFGALGLLIVIICSLSLTIYCLRKRKHHKLPPGSENRNLQDIAVGGSPRLIRWQPPLENDQVTHEIRTRKQKAKQHTEP